MKIVDFRTYYSANGGGKTLDLSWQEACEMFRYPKARLDVPFVAEEDTDEYKGWLKKVNEAKANAGYVFWGETKDGKKGKDDIVNHSALAIDYDGMQDKNFVPKPSCNYLLYSTTKHDKSDPHYRLIIPLSRPVVGDEYLYLLHKVLTEVGADGVDVCTLQDNRAMGYTVQLQGTEYVFTAVTDKEPLDVDAYLVSNWKDMSTWPRLPGEKEVIKKTKARIATGDNLVPADSRSIYNNGGYAGAMCTAYTVSAGIKKFLNSIYEPAEGNRYTYIGATGKGGLVLLEDKVAFSYHSTDPANDGKPHNIYELVAIHTGYSKKQMTELCKNDVEIMRAFRNVVAPTNTDIPQFAERWADLSVYPANDYGIALRLRDAYYGQVGWATDAKTWLIYDGIKWDDADMSHMYNLFPRIAEIMQTHALHCEDSKAVATIMGIVEKCQVTHYRESALKAFKGMVQLMRGDMDGDQWGLNTKSGYLRLHGDGDYLVPNSHTQHCCKYMDAGFSENFVPNQECIKFLETLLPDADTRHWLQKFMGYCLTGSTREKLGVFLHAPANNGKTSFINLVKNTFNSYCEGGDDKLITTSKYGGDANAPTPALASLAGARICLFDEIRAGKKIESGAWKQLTGGSPKKARKLQQAPFTFTPRCKILIACNDIPTVEDAHDPAMKIRIRIVPMTATFTGKNADKSIEDKIATADWKNTFLYWCFEGLQYYLAEGLDNYNVDTSIVECNMPALMKDAWRNYFREADEVGDFVNTYCKITHNKEDFVAFSDLYEKYCKENKNTFFDSKRAFSGKLKRYMEAQGLKDDRRMQEARDYPHDKTLQRGYAGIRFYTEDDIDEENTTIENTTVKYEETDVFSD